MARAIETGLPKLRIEEAAASKQARIDRGDDVIVGVNKYRLEEEEEVDILEIDNRAVRESQVARLARVRAAREPAAVDAILSRIAACAASGKGNLLELAVEATRRRASVGEISGAMESEFGRFRATARTVSGVYGAAFEQDESWRAIASEIEDFAARHGRRPRMLVCKMGQDGHDRGAKVIATAFADVGFDIDLSPMFSTPREVARQALENDVHAVGASSLAGGHKTLVPQLVAELGELGGGDIAVIAGGVIPRRDHESLRAAGVKCIFGPGTPIPECARQVLRAIGESAAGRR